MSNSLDPNQDQLTEQTDVLLVLIWEAYLRNTSVRNDSAKH